MVANNIHYMCGLGQEKNGINAMSDLAEKLKSVETYYQTQESKLKIKDRWTSLNCYDYCVVGFFVTVDQSCSNLQEYTLNNSMSRILKAVVIT